LDGFKDAFSDTWNCCQVLQTDGHQVLVQALQGIQSPLVTSDFEGVFIVKFEELNAQL
jgi:hypothetical protein